MDFPQKRTCCFPPSVRQSCPAGHDPIAAIAILDYNCSHWFFEVSISTEFCEVFTEAELQRLRRQEPWKQKTADKFFELVVYLTEQSFAAHPDKLL